MRRRDDGWKLVADGFTSPRQAAGLQTGAHVLGGVGFEAGGGPDRRRVCDVVDVIADNLLRLRVVDHDALLGLGRGFLAALGLDQALPLSIDVDAVLAGGSVELDATVPAFTAANDLAGIALVEALERQGRSVPDDASVVGFDGIVLTALAGVGLTTIAQPREEMARIGVRLLLERVSGEDGHPRHVLLEPELVIRKTTGRSAR